MIVTTDQWLRGIPYFGIGVVLTCFAAAAWVRAVRQQGSPGWPLAWAHLSALFLLFIGLLAFLVSGRVLLTYSDRHEHRVSYAVAWSTLAVSVWAFRRWLQDGEL